MDLNPAAVWDFAHELVGTVGGQGGRTLATVTRVDADGTVWVTTGDGGEAPVNGDVLAAAEPGQSVRYEIRDGTLSITGNASDPAAGHTAVAGIVKRSTAVISKAVDAARGIAEAAQKVAEATNQHFWTDTSGIHVTQVTQDEWSDAEGESYQSGPNVLINSIGQLFRDGLTNLLTMTTEDGSRAMTVWDGFGNAAENVLASFGEVVRIGRANAVRTEIGSGTFTIKDSASAYLMRFYSRNTNADGSATVSMTATGNGSATTFTPVYAPTEVVSAAYADGTELEPPTISGKSFAFASAPTAKAFTVTYKTMEAVYYASLGTRLASDSSGTYGQGNASMALGRLNAATTQGATAIGRNNKATATDAYAIGRANMASAQYAYAMGNASTASASSAIAFGNASEASAPNAVAIGNGAYAGGSDSVAIGNNATATGDAAYAIGRYLSAAADDQMVIGRYNDEDDAGTYGFLIGNGTGSSNLHNALGIEAETGVIRSWNRASGESGFKTVREDTGVSVGFIVGSGGVNHGVYSYELRKWLLYGNRTSVYVNGNVIPDSIGWTNLTLGSGATAYGSSTTPKYCRKCGIVELVGEVSPTSQVASGGTLAIGTLPTGCRPQMRIEVLCQGSGNREWMLQVGTDGSVTASRYRLAGASEAIPTSAWLPFHVTFIAAS